MDLDRTSKETARDAWSKELATFFMFYGSGILEDHFESVLPSIGRAIATQAWSQVVDSVISDNPPSDMSEEYYHSRPESGFDYLQEQLKHLDI